MVGVVGTTGGRICRGNGGKGSPSPACLGFIGLKCVKAAPTPTCLGPTKVRSGSNKAREFTSQLFFEEKTSDLVYTKAPYNSKGGSGRTLNSQDGIYRSGGSQLLLPLTQEGAGYATTFTLGLQF
jgi:hypothetical protein